MGQLGQRRGCIVNALGTRGTPRSPPFFPSAQNGAPRLRLDVWEKGNISIVQLEEKLRGAARQALADGIMELRLLPASLCTEDTSPGTWGPENTPGPWKTVVAGEIAKMGVQEGITEAPSKIQIHGCPLSSLHQQGDTPAKCTHAVGHPLREGYLLTNVWLSVAHTVIH